jgi:hypothetical protein
VTTPRRPEHLRGAAGVSHNASPNPTSGGGECFVMLKYWLATAAAAVLGLTAASVAAGPVLPASTATYTLTQAFPQVTNYAGVVLPVGSYRDDSDGFGDDVHAFTAANFNGGGPAVNIQTFSSGSGEVTLKYYYEITGPAGQNVPVDLSGSIYAFGFPYPDLGSAWAGATGSIGVPAGGYYAQGCASFEAGGCPVGANFGTTPLNAPFSVPTNTAEWILLDAKVDAEDYGSEFVAQVDPIISLDPSVSDPQDYQILVSPDVMNGYPPAVPEPSTWAMLLLGVFGLGAVLRTARKGQWKSASAA